MSTGCVSVVIFGGEGAERFESFRSKEGPRDDGCGEVDGIASRSLEEDEPLRRVEIPTVSSSPLLPGMSIGADELLSALSSEEEAPSLSRLPVTAALISA